MESLKELHTSLVDEHYNVYDTLVEKVKKLECVMFPTIKLEIENLKRKLIQTTSLSCSRSSYSSDKWTIFKKTLA